VVTRYY